MGRIVIFLALFFSIVSCEDKFSTVHSRSLPAQASIRRNDTIIKDSITNLFFTRLSNKGSFGMMYTYYPPDDVRDKLIEVVFSGKARTSYPHSNASIVVTVGSKKDVQQGWTGRNIRYVFTDINTWCEFKDSVVIQREAWQDPYYRIDVFAYLPGPTAENFDLDTLHVKIKVKQ